MTEEIISDNNNRNEQNVVVEITDFGGGIKKEDMEKIFKTFYTTKKKGNGLGLSISLDIMESHNGEIKIESKLNEGTSVKLFFPVSCTI